MKTIKYLPLGLVAGAAFSLASCDDSLDCGCECNVPKVTSFEFLDPATMKDVNKQIKDKVHTAQVDSFKKNKVASGTTVIVFGENLAEVTAIKYGDKEATLYPTLINDNQIIFKVPEGITQSATPRFCTKGCPTGVKGLPKVFLGEPCVSMCDNEFAMKTINVKGNSLVDGLEAYFWNEATQAYDLKSPKVDARESEATIEVPSGFGKNHPIMFKTGAGESFSSFIFHDERGMMVTRDDEEYLNKFLLNIPDNDIDETVEGNDAEAIRKATDFTKQDLEKLYFQSENTNGNFSIFWSGTGGYQALNFDLPYGINKNGIAVEDVPGTVFGFGKDGLYGDDAMFGDITKYCVKFEAFVSDDFAPLQGLALAIGFREGMDDNTLDGYRKYCAVFQPAELVFDKPLTGGWSIKSANPWTTGGDWMTIAIPMDQFLFNVADWNVETAAENGRYNNEDASKKYEAFGSGVDDKPYYVNNAPNTHANESPITKYEDEMENNPFNSFGISYNEWTYALKSDFAIAIDNVRIGLDDKNGGVYEMLKWGVPTRDFYVAPITSCAK